MYQVHPFVVHFPLALFITASFVGVVGLFFRRGLFKELVFWQIAIGQIFLGLAIYTGLEEAANIKNASFDLSELVEVHKRNSYIIGGIFLALTIWMGFRKRQMGTPEYASYLVFLLIGSIAVIYQGYLGSKMVFKEGVGVAPVEVQKKAELERKESEAEAFPLSKL